MPFFCAYHLKQVGGVFPVGLLAPGRVAGAHIASQKQEAVVPRKGGLGVDGVVILLRAQELFIVADGEQGGGEKHHAHAFFQRLAQIDCRVDAEQADKKAAVPVDLGVDHIVFVHPLVDRLEHAHLEVQRQHFFPDVPPPCTLPGTSPSRPSRRGVLSTGRRRSPAPGSRRTPASGREVAGWQSSSWRARRKSRVFTRRRTFITSSLHRLALNISRAPAPPGCGPRRPGRCSPPFTPSPKKRFSLAFGSNT